MKLWPHAWILAISLLGPTTLLATPPQSGRGGRPAGVVQRAAGGTGSTSLLRRGSGIARARATVIRRGAVGRHATAPRGSRVTVETRGADAVGRQPQRAAATAALEDFSHVVVDARGDRGGNGDVAAAYLTGVEMGNQLQFKGTITVLASEQGLRVLSKMSGQQLTSGSTLQKGNARLHVATIDALPDELPAVDLYLNVAGRTGLQPAEARFALAATAGALAPAARGTHLPVHQNTTYVMQPVMGNTENGMMGTIPNAHVWSMGGASEMRPAGPGTSEIGVYRDPIAARLRGQPPARIAGYVRATLRRMPASPTRQALTDLAEGRALAGARPALAYGIGSEQTTGQFGSYLSGAVERAVREHTSFAIVTPSRFSAERIPEALRDRVEYVYASNGGALPHVAEPGRVYVVEVGTLPHDAFVAQMARSELPPIVSGDGALSAAMGLGRPFVMTALPWSAKNVRSVGTRVARAASPSLRPALDALFTVHGAANGPQTDLSSAAKLHGPEVEHAFAAATEGSDTFTSQVVLAAQRARALMTTRPTAALASSVDDRALQLSTMAAAYARGNDPAARRTMERYAARNPQRTLGLLYQNILPPRILSAAPVRHAIESLARRSADPWTRQFAATLLAHAAPAAAAASGQR